ncbi:MAG: glutamate dehydrogenase, partial [Candidatus Gracilibacteria bacterium]
NAGGVTVSYFEQVQNGMNYYWTLQEVQEKLKVIMVTAWNGVNEISKKYKCTYRMAAFIKAMSRLAELAVLRGKV